MGGEVADVDGAALESGGKFLGSGRVAGQRGTFWQESAARCFFFAAAWQRFAARWPEGKPRRLSSVWSKGRWKFSAELSHDVEVILSCGYCEAVKKSSCSRAVFEVISRWYQKNDNVILG